MRKSSGDVGRDDDCGLRSRTAAMPGSYRK